jgi:hypothetical protein
MLGSSRFAMLMWYVTVPPTSTLDGDRDMFSTTPLPLQLAGLWFACAATAPKSQMEMATIASDRRRRFANRRPSIRLVRLPFPDMPITSVATNGANNERREDTRGPDMTTPLGGSIRPPRGNRWSHPHVD